MALNFQTSTLSLTLPISCQICLGKVKQPVICANHHVFCSVCMEMWLKKASQCPTCRVPITAENPCREIIGGSNESDHSDSLSVRKCLRKTRGELLLREYEDEIEGLIRENEELKAKNQSLELQLKTALEPCSINTLQTNDKRVDPYVLEEWTNKLRAATDVCDKVKKFSSNFFFFNVLCKMIFLPRFGRYTVAALEAKIQQYDREVDHLKRALERSDQYIEDLESRVRKLRQVDIQEKSRTDAKTESEDFTQQHKINMMMRSLSDNERESICSNPEVQSQTYSRKLFEPSAGRTPLNKCVPVNQKSEDLDSASSDFLPSTPSNAFRSLTLRSPRIREKKVAFKPTSYMRRLDFGDFPSPGKSSIFRVNQFSSNTKSPKEFSPNTDLETSKSLLWDDWQKSESADQSCPGPSKESTFKGATSTNLAVDDPDSFHMSSEASMDAAYLDKISELDSMMLDGESASSRGSQLSLVSTSPADLDNTVVPEPQTCSDSLPNCGGKPVMECDQHSPSARNTTDFALNGKEAPEGSTEGRTPALLSGKESGATVPGHDGTSQTEEMSFELLFDPLEENKDGPPASLCSEIQHDSTHPSCSSTCTGKPVNTIRDRHTLNMSQPTKRKSHSPFNTNSPTKLSKLM
uniref:RING-type domain-containing protein n=1 Tax=Sphaeramia orbicularis TaxID=375764 RepID=A0A673BHG4_9TELE